MAARFELELDIVVELDEALASISEVLEPHLSKIEQFTVRTQSPGASMVLIVQSFDHDCLAAIVDEIYGEVPEPEYYNEYITQIA